MCWDEDEPPADEILGARLRAKYYGALVVTYRDFLLKILEHSAAKSSAFDQISSDFKHGIEATETLVDEIPTPVLEYAKACIRALIKSTTAFHGLPQDKRLIVTNVWGTAHAYVTLFLHPLQNSKKTILNVFKFCRQWGNMLTLQAVYCDPILKPFMDPKLLSSLLHKTILFLRQVAQPSSALWTDIKILEHTGIKNGLLRLNGCSESMASSFNNEVTAEH